MRKWVAKIGKGWITLVPVVSGGEKEWQNFSPYGKLEILPAIGTD